MIRDGLPPGLDFEDLMDAVFLMVDHLSSVACCLRLVSAMGDCLATVDSP